MPALSRRSLIFAILIGGVRVTPNVYTTPDEIDVFVDAVKMVLARGI